MGGGDAAGESNLDSMDGLASPLRVRLRPRRLARLEAATRRRIAVAAGLLALLAGGWIWVRDSSLVAVREVVVVGSTSSQETRVREALTAAARDMTTLHVRVDALRGAVAPYASVADLDVDAAPPHKLTIEVVERKPAALVAVGVERIPVTSGGLLLRGVRPDPALPQVRMDQLPSGGQLTDAAAGAAVGVLAGAPPELHGRVDGARMGAPGLVVGLRDGPDLVFGTADRSRAKWAAALRVLAASSAKGATYLDLRIPEWTAAGGVGPVEPEPTAAPVAETTPDPQP